VPEVIHHDRGLGSAYERYVFYQWVDRWATTYGITSALEGPHDGMAGVPGVHGVGLARRGIPVVSAVSGEPQAEVTRAVYARAKAPVTVRVIRDAEDTELAPADLVIVYHSLSLVPDWRSYLRSRAKLARKLLVVTVCNPDNWGVSAMRLLARARGMRGFEPPESWHTETLAPVLWELGRIREHVYFDCPWWPDLPGISAGQSLKDRLTKLVGKNMQFTPDALANTELATKFVYGAERWPYFGGDGWTTELLPALLRHPSFEGVSPALARRSGHLHAFVVDTSPRSPQAKRRLTKER
jgi:hypothetical protein